MALSSGGGEGKGPLTSLSGGRGGDLEDFTPVFFHWASVGSRRRGGGKGAWSRSTAEREGGEGGRVEVFASPRRSRRGDCRILGCF